MAAHPDVILELVVGSPFAKALLKEHFPPRFLMSGNSEGFAVSFLILAITSVALTSFPSPGRERSIFQCKRKSSVLCLSGQLCPSLNLGLFNFPAAPGLSSSLSWLHSVLQQLDTGVHMWSQQREATTAFASSHSPFSATSQISHPPSYITFHSDAKRAPAL